MKALILMLLVGCNGIDNDCGGDVDLDWECNCYGYIIDINEHINAFVCINVEGDSSWYELMD